MKASKFSAAQKAFVIKQGEEGTPVVRSNDVWAMGLVHDQQNGPALIPAGGKLGVMAHADANHPRPSAFS